MLATFTCYFPTENPLFFTVKANTDAWLQQLLKAIYVKLDSRGTKNVNFNDLRFFKTDVPIQPKESLQLRVLQWLHEQPAGSQLNGMNALELSFPDGPHPREGGLKLDVIVADAEVLELIEGLGDPDNVYNRKIRKALDKRLDGLSCLPSSSDVVASSHTLAEALGGTNPQIHLGRPGCPPPNRFACFFPAENPDFIPIEIESDGWVDELRQAILVELHLCGRKDIKFNDLHLFKTDVPIQPKESLQLRALQWLHEQPVDSQLNEMSDLLSVFPNGPHPRIEGDLMLDIIVANAEVLELIEDLGDPYAVYKRKIRKALDKHIDGLSCLFSSSDVVSSSHTLAEALGGTNPQIHLGRPGCSPAVIFNSTLAILQQHFDDLEQLEVSRVEVNRAANYVHCAVRFYEEEAARLDAIERLVNDAIGDVGNWNATGDDKSDATWSHGPFAIMFLQLKNTSGLGGDAICQAALDYSKKISQDEYKHFRPYCNFPAVLIGVTANRLEISVAVCVGPVYVTKLLTLELSLGFHASENCVRLARLFKALSHCHKNLKKYYDGVIKLASPKLSCLFPNPTAIDPSQKLPKLTYRQFLSRAGQPTSDLLDLGNVCTAMYAASLALDDGTNTEVIVKFTARYNEAAHRLLAEAGFAPTLHFCGRVVGGLYMIVMDCVAGKSIWQLQMAKTPIPAIVAKEVEQAVDLLHKEDIVFGDLRTNNILYVASESRVVLVDFDWPGKDGESRYPPTLNPYTQGKSWAEDVLPYGIMRKDHDLWQLGRLKVLCGSNV